MPFTKMGKTEQSLSRPAKYKNCLFECIKSTMPIRKPIRNGKLEVEHMNLARVQGKPGDKRNKIGSHWRTGST